VAVTVMAASGSARVGAAHHIWPVVPVLMRGPVSCVAGQPSCWAWLCLPVQQLQRPAQLPRGESGSTAPASGAVVPTTLETLLAPSLHTVVDSCLSSLDPSPCGRLPYCVCCHVPLCVPPASAHRSSATSLRLLLGSRALRPSVQCSAGPLCRHTRPHTRSQPTTSQSRHRQQPSWQSGTSGARQG
jgi:hypothetical protein